MKEILATKFMKSLNQVNSKLTVVEGGVINGLRLMKDENFYVCVHGKNMEKMRLLFIKLSLVINEDDGNSTCYVPQLRFTLQIQISLYMVTKKS